VTDGLYPFYGAQIGVCGDSISSAAYGGLSWPDEMADMLHATTHNVAVSGNVMRDAVTQMGGLTLSNNDVLIVWLGTNDYGNGSGTVYGTLGDDHTSNTFYGDVDYVINTALAGNPEIALGFILTTKRFDTTSANSRGKVLTDYIQAIKDVCTKYSIPYLDLYGESGVNATTEGTLLGDHLHPTGFGRHIYARKIAAFVRSL
jgi:lysophospholipase L1-like esterase